MIYILSFIITSHNNYYSYLNFRLAVTNSQFLSNVLGIKDPIHKQKISLKAMDVVLFGPPKG